MKKFIVISILIILPLLIFRYIKKQKQKEIEIYKKAKQEIIRKLSYYYVSGGGGGFNNLATEIGKYNNEERTNILIRKVIYEKINLENGFIGNEKIPNEIWIKLRYDLTEK